MSSAATGAERLQRLYTPKQQETWTITFGECVENHAGMVKHGQLSDRGFTYEEIVNAGYVAQDAGFEVEFYDLTSALPDEQKELLSEEELKSACVIVIRQGAKMFFEEKDYPKFVEEVKSTRDIVDKKAKMKGKVVNKHARYNLCYADTHIKANYEVGQGTVVAFDEVPYLQQIREMLPSVIGDAANGLFAELNYYYDVNKCGIGYHGDSERRYVIAIRVGADLPLHYQWYYERQAIGPNTRIDVKGGDVYFMGDTAVGNNWKRWKVPTLRHAAGCKKYTS